MSVQKRRLHRPTSRFCITTVVVAEAYRIRQASAVACTCDNPRQYYSVHNVHLSYIKPNLRLAVNKSYSYMLQPYGVVTAIAKDSEAGLEREPIADKTSEQCQLLQYTAVGLTSHPTLTPSPRNASIQDVFPSDNLFGETTFVEKNYATHNIQTVML